jgi:pimeloyl-ACP methyl ester carboxylesterase
MSDGDRAGQQIFLDAGDARLAGEVWHPESDLRAGVVMIGGSGPTERSNDGYFVAYRDQFTSHGIAVLWYDKRGVGGSTGDWAAGTLDDLARDATAGVSALRHALGDAVPVGLFGHSEGGRVALRAAAWPGQVSFVVTNSCPGMTPGQADRQAFARAVAAEAWPDHDKAAALRLYDELAQAAADDREFAHVRQLLAAAPQHDMLRPYLEPLDEAMWAFFKREHDHDPIPDCLSLRCPHLAIFGSADRLVPVAESAGAFSAAACTTGRHPLASLTIHVVPGADHRLRTGADAVPAAHHLAHLCGWITIAAQAGRGSVSDRAG